MRDIVIDFTGQDKPVSFFVGYTGEANNTQLTVRLPQTLCSVDIDYYRAVFKTVSCETERSGKLYALDGAVTFTMWSSLLRYPGTLLLQISAFDFNGNELIRLGKTPVAALQIRPSLPPGPQAETDLSGLEAELETLLHAQNGGNPPVRVYTFTGLPAPVEQGSLALVRNPPPRYVPRSVRPILGHTNYPRLYINPYPPRPEHVFTGDDRFSEVGFFAHTIDGMNYDMTFFFHIFDGFDEGLPSMLQMATSFEEGAPLYVYCWDSFDLEEDLHIVPGWYRAYIRFDNGDLLSIEPMSTDELPVIEFAGRTDSSSVYLGYYLSPDSYFEHANHALYIYDRMQWRRLEDADTAIPVLGVIPVRGIEFPSYTVVCTVGIQYELELARVYPFFATNRTVTYSVSDDSVIELVWQDENEGSSPRLFVVGLKAGTATLTATSAEGGFSKSLPVIVMEA